MSLTFEYFLLVFIAGLGFLQFAAMKGGLRGIWLSLDSSRNRFYAAVLAFPAMLAFFTWNYRNPVGIIEGAQQAGLFSLAAALSILFTLALSSLINRNKLKPSVKFDAGLEALKSRTYYQILKAKFGNANQN
ncbi:hypothetical protein [Dehalogenimonas alkenigignens]|uniref:Uncharacterized protein n=1 Tax=Dehalogenimonas alkenigignens TaxID=1217799 RepID=A0A0W0GIZ7_9CHLR|nr:hypothetical protein [Dehalogenimonas alkenigignens]KTB48533.1 hypothetical protein DEALK_13790 [Dehalogenimonas alkenigignens]PVV85021.1 hypothetical protein DD509_01635 [Dehalogenimonas alkenigignens]